VLLEPSNHERQSHDGLRLRFTTWRRQTRLDAALAEGDDPGNDPALALRARQLTELSRRHAIARTLRNVIDAAEEPPHAWGHGGPRPPLQRDAILTARNELLSIADRLTEPRDVSPQAAALASMMVWDSASPLYASDTDATVSGWARAVTETIDSCP
jgi:hypothetical protein